MISVLFVIIITYCRDDTLDDRRVCICLPVCKRLDVCEVDDDRRLFDEGIGVIYCKDFPWYLYVYLLYSTNTINNTNVNELIIYKINVVYFIILLFFDYEQIDL